MTYRTTSSILARVGVTFIDLNLTVGSSIARTARASVTSLASIGAGGSVLARLVVSAVVKVCTMNKANH